MKNNQKKNADDVRRLRLKRSAIAASNIKFACEFALACMDLQQQANSPALMAGLNKNIREVLSALDRDVTEESVRGQYVTELDALGAIFLDQLNPVYAASARRCSFQTPQCDS